MPTQSFIQTHQINHRSTMHLLQAPSCPFRLQTDSPTAMATWSRTSFTHLPITASRVNPLVATQPNGNLLDACDLPGTLVGAGAGVTTFNGSIIGDSKYLML